MHEKTVGGAEHPSEKPAVLGLLQSTGDRVVGSPGVTLGRRAADWLCFTQHPAWGEQAQAHRHQHPDSLCLRRLLLPALQR